MADQRTMAKLLRAPTEGYVEAIVVPQFLLAKLTHAVNQQTSAVTTAMTTILKQFQATPPLASVKAVEEICVTCGSAHPYYLCLADDGNTFLKLRDNIQGYVLAAAINYNHVVPLSELEKIKRVNEANMKAMQTQINNVKNQLRNELKILIQASMSNQTNELKNIMASFFQMNTASTSGSGSLPSNTIANLKVRLKSITTRSRIVLDGPSVPIPPPFINPEEDERVEETLTDQDLAKYTIKVPPPLVQNPSLLPEKLGDPGKFLILGKFTFPADFVIVDYKSDPIVPLILGRPFLRTARALIDVNGEEMILRDSDERLTLNMRHDNSGYSSKPQKVSINMINIFNNSSEDFLEELCIINHQSGNLTFSSNPKLTSLEVKDDIFDPKRSNVIKSLNDNPTPDHVLKPLFPSPIPYDSFLFEIEPDQGKLTSVVMKDNLAEPRVHVPNVLTTHPTLMLDSDFIPSDNSSPEFKTFYFDIKEKNIGSTTIHADLFFWILNVSILILSPVQEDHSPLFPYVVWIFLSFLTYPVVPPHLFSFRNEDTIFNPGIANYHFSSLLPDVSHRCETFMKFNVYQKLLNESLMEILSSSCSPMEP
nr:reverse transcriptase domain-containing protein [Tanacetum cinerariifolium]